MDEALSQDVSHINNFPLLGGAQVALGILFSCVARWLFLFHSTNTSFFFLLVSFGEFWQENYVGMWGHYGSIIMGVYSGPFSETLGLTIDLFGWYRPFIYGGLCPIYFSRELGFSGSYLCSRFCIFDRFVLEKYVIKLRGVHTSFSHAFVQFEIVFFSQLRRCTLLLRI
jgi:hypothetical protein